MIVLFPLLAYREHHDFRPTDDLMQRDIPTACERNDQFPLGWVLCRFAEAEGRDRQAMLRRRFYLVDRCLGTINVLGRLGTVDQEVKESLQVVLGRSRQLDGKTHRPSFLRLASSLDCSHSRTASTETEAPVRS